MSRRTQNILFSILSVILVVCIAMIFISDRKKSAEIAKENGRIMEEVENTDNQRLEEGRKIYEALAKEIADKKIGIVCWGDSEMLGNSEDSLAVDLEAAVNDSLFEDIDNDFAKKANLYETKDLHIDVINYGTANEDIRAIMARSGARSIFTANDFEIPADNNQVAVDMADEYGNRLLFAKQDNVEFGRTSINGVEGELYAGSETYDNVHSKYSFGREKDGDAVSVIKGTEIITEGSTEYRDYYPLLFFGEQEGMSGSDFASCLREIADAYGNEGQCSVVCTTAADSEYDIALRYEFGDQYFRNDKTAENMTDEDYKELAGRIYESMSGQDVFSPVKSSVNKARKELKKSVKS